MNVNIALNAIIALNLSNAVAKATGSRYFSTINTNIRCIKSAAAKVPANTVCQVFIALT
jgi:hypothetical protein